MFLAMDLRAAAEAAQSLSSFILDITPFRGSSARRVAEGVF
jgi:hypothetical protein